MASQRGLHRRPTEVAATTVGKELTYGIRIWLGLLAENQLSAVSYDDVLQCPCCLMHIRDGVPERIQREKCS